MYGRVYTIRVTPTATPAAAACDFLEIVPASNKPVVIHKVVITPMDLEVNQQVAVTVKTMGATFTSGSTGGTAPTTGPRNSHDAAAAFTAENFNTSRASTSGTTTYHANESFPTQGGYEYLPDVTERPIIFNGEGFVVGIEEAINGGSGLIGGYAVVEEL